MLAVYFCLLHLFGSFCLLSSLTNDHQAVSYLLRQSSSVNHHLENVRNNLKRRHIALDKIDQPMYGRLKEEEANNVEDRIAMSTKRNPLKCRITLQNISPGKFGVSPCGCKGSQKWASFSLVNRLRRTDPLQWSVRCPTCLQPFDYSMMAIDLPDIGEEETPPPLRDVITKLPILLLTHVIDNPTLLHSSFALFILGAFTLLNQWFGLSLLANRFFLRVITSRMLWQHVSDLSVYDNCMFEV